MTVLITGAGGFVGYHLIDYLNKQNEQEIYGTVFSSTDNLNIPEENVFKLDLTSKENVHEVLERVRPTEIYHLAAQSSVGLSWNKPIDTILTNIVGTVNLLETIKELKLKCRILIIGSSEQYGEVTPDMLPINEKYETNASNPYAITKKTQEEFAKLYSKDMDIIFVRAFNHIGPRQSDKFVVSNWLHQIVNMEKSADNPILKVGNIKVKRDFTDVRDIVRGYYLLMRFGKNNEVYNIGSGRSISLEELLNIMSDKSLLEELKIEIDSQRLRSNDIPDIYCDNSKIHKDIGWKPEISIETSIEDTIKYVRELIN